MAVEIHEDQPLVEPAAPLEGTYATWTATWSMTHIPNLDVEVAFLDNQGNLYAWLDVGTHALVYDITGAQIYDSGPGNALAHSRPFYKSWSVLDRYHLLWERFLGGIWRVVEYGVEIFTRDPALDVAAAKFPEGCCISPDGHYICAICEDAVSGRDKIIIVYEGA